MLNRSTCCTLFSSTISPGPGGHELASSRVIFWTSMLPKLGSAQICMVLHPAVDVVGGDSVE